MLKMRQKLAALSLAAITLLQCPLMGSAAVDSGGDETAGEQQEAVVCDSISADIEDDEWYDITSPVGTTDGQAVAEDIDIDTDIDTYDTPTDKLGAEPSAALKQYNTGDINGDGVITVTDATYLLRYHSKVTTLTFNQKKACDVDGDGRVTITDAVYIVRYATGVISKFPKVETSDTDTSSDNNNSASPSTDTSKSTDTAKSSETDNESNKSNGFGDNATEDTSIAISGTSYSVPVGMTLYVTASSGVTWGSTNTNIATVDSNGLILGKKAGTVRIIALKGSKKRTINLTVTAAEPVRTVYTSPNSAAKGSTVKFIATTDQTRTAVRFEVDINGTKKTVNATSKTADNSHGIYTWTGTMTASTVGNFSVKAYSQKDGKWTTCSNGATTMFVSSSSSSSQVALNTLRASDKVIQMISEFEGGLAEAEYDPLAYGDVMNYGYGVVIGAGEKFYNKAAMSEYFADLVNQVNENVYSSYVNQFLQNNKIKYNQNQFDALVCFTYNLGVYSLENAGLKSILLNCYEPASGTSSNTATVSVSGYLNLRSGAGTNYSVIGKLYNGDVVTILDSNKVNGVWLKVKAPDGTVGYCSSDYLIIGGGTGSTRNFNYINSNALITELLAWHHAGGTCYWGLLYRRIDELEMFLYADYTRDGYNNKYGWTLPSCIAG